MTNINLLSPARYFPIDKGLYEVAPGLKSLGHSFGNGERDGYVFQFDSQFEKYRKNRIECRKERLEKYYQLSNYSPQVSSAVNRSIIEKLTKEHSELFNWKPTSSGGELLCLLTGEVIELDASYELRAVKNSTQNYVSAYDAICSQLQEDVAVMCTSEDGKDWLAALHLCSASHWSAEDKIGKNFLAIHAPVPGIEKVNNAAKSLIEAMINKGPYIRFVWLFGSDDRLNHNPEPPPGFDPIQWKGQNFDPNKTNGSPFILRLERQTLYGLPQVRSFVFTIRTYFIDGEEIRSNPKENALLRSALLSMTPESRKYKGLKDNMDQVIAWLDHK